MNALVKKWEEISRENIFHKYGRGIDRVVYKLPDGRESDFYLKCENASVCALALTKDNQVILARQFRPGPNEILTELPGGALDQGESPEQAMERELLEETGYQGKAELVTASFDCAYSNVIRYCMVATDCEKVSEPSSPDESEFTEPILMSLADFRKHLRSGKLTDVEVGYLGLDYLGLL